MSYHDTKYEVTRGAKPVKFCDAAMVRLHEVSAEPVSIRGIDPDFTGGLDSAEYLKRRWSGDDAWLCQRQDGHDGPHRVVIGPITFDWADDVCGYLTTEEYPGGGDPMSSFAIVTRPTTVKLARQLAPLTEAVLATAETPTDAVQFEMNGRGEAALRTTLSYAGKRRGLRVHVTKLASAPGTLIAWAEKR